MEKALKREAARHPLGAFQEKNDLNDEKRIGKSRIKLVYARLTCIT
jgi:hypothetical protein